MAKKTEKKVETNVPAKKTEKIGYFQMLELASMESL